MSAYNLRVLKGRILKGVRKGKVSDFGPETDGSRYYGGVHGQNTDAILFQTNAGDYVFAADGDCCSRTYIDSVSGPTEGVVQDVEDGSYDSSRNGEVKHYSTKLVIAGKGYLDIEYRNESNGYYGGDLVLYRGPENAEEDKA